MYQLTLGQGDTRGAREAFAALLKSAAILTGRSIEDLRSETTGITPDVPAFSFDTTPTEPNATEFLVGPGELPSSVDPDEVIGEYDAGIVIVDYQREAKALGHQRPAGTFTEDDLERVSPFDGVAEQAAQNEEQMEHDLANGLRVIVHGIPLPKDVADAYAAGTHEIVNGIAVPLDEVEEDIARLRAARVSPIVLGVGDNSTIVPDEFVVPDEGEPLTVDASGALVELVPQYQRLELATDSMPDVTVTASSSYTPASRRHRTVTAEEAAFTV